MEPEHEKENRRIRGKTPKVSPAKKPGTPGPPGEPPKKPKKKKVTTFARQRERRLQNLVQNFELLSLVCQRHVEGATIKEIHAAVKEKFPKVVMKREDPGWIVRWAARPPRSWLEFRPPHNLNHCSRIRDLYPRVQEVKVVRSSEVAVVARGQWRRRLRLSP